MRDRENNEYKITRDMESQANILEINLRDLKLEIKKAGGPKKFREEANQAVEVAPFKTLKGFKGNETLEKMTQKIGELQDILSEKLIGGAGLSLLAVGGSAGIFESLNSNLEGAQLGAQFSIYGIVLSVGAAVSIIRKKIESRKRFIEAKKTEMKLNMTGAEINPMNFKRIEEEKELRRQIAEEYQEDEGKSNHGK